LQEKKCVIADFEECAELCRRLPITVTKNEKSSCDLLGYDAMLSDSWACRSEDAVSYLGRLAFSVLGNLKYDTVRADYICRRLATLQAILPSHN